MKVSNIINSNGNPAPNQFIIETEKGKMFQSYDSNIAFRPANGDSIIIGPDWDCSTTTGKYRNIFLNEKKADTQRKLDSGVYIYDKDL